MKRELSLFSGAGGGLLASHHMLGWRCVGYVEWEGYCQRVIAQRIRDGLLSEAPIYGDIRAFVSEGYAASYTGMVDIITGGFPCQPFSVAGQRKGAGDERNMWPPTADVIGIIKPREVYLENVPGLLASSSMGYFGNILADLSGMGYDCQWGTVGADNAGAWHRRKRVWILAHAK